MIQIAYPRTAYDMNIILDEYVKVLNIDDNARKRFDKFSKTLKLKYNFHILSLDSMLKANFSELCNVLECMPKISSREQKWLKLFFKYDKYQPKIASFFMNNRDKISLKSCYYCNIDYISVFKDISDYQSGLDFVKRASEEELSRVKDIGTKTIDVILSNREFIENLDDLSISSQKKDNIEKFHLNKEHSHFTLDHIIDKGDHPIFALSFYNFVPSCYSCNSKFKKNKKLITKSNIQEFLSPTSSKFQFHKDVKFKIFFYIDGKEDKNKKISSITSEKDFTISLDYSNKAYKSYIDIFKLEGRYKFHKEEVVNMVTKSIRYPTSNLKKIAKLVNKNVEDVKSDIFGIEIFTGELEDVPLTKFKRDIAKNIDLI